MSQLLDKMIRNNGEVVTLRKFRNIVFDPDYDTIDLDLSTFKPDESIKMLVDTRSGRTVNIQQSGWDAQDTLTVFFESTVDVSVRNGSDADIIETSDEKRFRVTSDKPFNYLGSKVKRYLLEPLRGKITA